MSEVDTAPLEPLHRGDPYHDKNWEKIRIASTLGSFIGKIPVLKYVVLTFLQKYRVFFYKYKSIALREHEALKVDVDKIFWVDPNVIYYTSIKEFDVSKDKGKVFGGDWDILERPFEKISVFVAFQERFLQGKDWKDTVYYQRILKKIYQGEYLFDCKNKSELDTRFQKLEELYEAIKKNGYKSQPELFMQRKGFAPSVNDDEITVNIGRNGDLLFNNGAHRLTIAKLLNIKKIPIKITVRHKEWVDFKKQILLYSNDQPEKKIYAPLLHIDLQDITSFHDDSEERFNVIRKNLTVKKGLLLDIGAHWGYFCQQFESLGFTCYAVENDSMNLYFLKKLKTTTNSKFNIISKSIFDYNDADAMVFDVVLALNIFHHFLKNEADFNHLVCFLKKLKARELYFQPHNPAEEQMEGAFKNFSEKEFVNFILENSSFTQAKKIGKGKHQRDIYKFFNPKPVGVPPDVE